MPCYHPIKAFRTGHGDIVFVERGDIHSTLYLPCGQCIGCRLERSRQWAVRCMHEASLYKQNCFITLTYRDDCLPANGSLNYRDFQLFMKRLRKSFPNSRIRFYMCGEYGEDFNRPHFHACLFNFDFEDKVPVRLLSGSSAKLFKSKTLERLWPSGFGSIGAVTFESAAYVARYVMKKVNGDRAKDHYLVVDEDGVVSSRTPEFNKMSLKPGIGADWLGKYYSDVYPDGNVVVRGFESKSPRYYDRRFSKIDPLGYEGLMYSRELAALDRWEDQSDDRLRVREQVAQARVRSLKRTIS